ncbi:MAG: LysM peptidoglycan-binding domain-containing protein [Anaerolineae bacterium]|nr:LysM peptidoglycan-binding domain-containing protein [Anaerolineae bacterium]
MPQRSFIHRYQWVLFAIAICSVLVTPAAAQSGSQHVVQRGETLFRIALRYGLTVETLVYANNLANPNQIYAGQVLNIPTPGATANPVPDSTGGDQTVAAPTPTSAPVYHIVQAGETLARIAASYGVNWTDLAAANNIANPNHILVGQQIVIMSSSAPDTAAVPGTLLPSPVVEEPVVANPVVTPVPTSNYATTHIVQRGESLSIIARIYGVTWSDIARANGIVDPNRIYAGQSLTIPAAGSGYTNYTYMEPTTGQPVGPTPTITSGRQIIVDLSDQRVYAYENGALLRSVVVSTGLPGTPTVTGDFNIYWKLTSQTMQGPGYYLPGVPWVMYFYQGYALHGTYWHSNFGQPMSHGCVNLPTDEAAWFFNWAEVGTPVRVIY